MQLDWLTEFAPNQFFLLSISQFQFQHPNTEGDPFTVAEFAKYVAPLNDFNRLSLRKISLSCAPYADEYTRLECQQLALELLEVEDIIAGFLEEFMPRLNLCETLTLTRCEFPKMRNPIQGYLLCLNTILDSGSLEIIFNLWDGTNMSLTSRPAFDDYLLNWLSRENHPVTVPDILDIVLTDCSNFTPAALLDFLERRRQTFSARKTARNHLRGIKASWDIPGLTGEDIFWVQRVQKAVVWDR